MDKANMGIEPGIMAMVIGCVDNGGEYSGSIVTPIRLAEEGDYLDFREYEEGDWLCEDEDDCFIYNQRNLMPIRPEEDPLEVERKLEMRVC